MFGISLSELLLILLVSLFLFKPKDIIKFIQQIISYYENLKNEIENIKSEIILLEEDKFTQEEVINEFENNDNDKKPNK